jgi:hypothetical protein
MAIAVVLKKIAVGLMLEVCAANTEVVAITKVALCW